MSFIAHTWSSQAPVANVYEYAVLNRMAEEADEFGEGAFVSVPTIAGDIQADKQSVRKAIAALTRRGLIALGDQERARYIRADRRPKVYDLLIPARAFMDLERTNRRRAEKGMPPITEETRPVQDPPPAEDMRVKRSDVGVPRPRKLGDTQEEQDEIDRAADLEAQDGVSATYPVTGSTPHTPSATGYVVDTDGVCSRYGRGMYDIPDPEVLDPVVLDPTNKKNPPPLSEGKSLPRETSEPPGEDLTDSEKQLLTDAADRAVAERSGRTGWTRAAVVDAMLDQLAAGHSPQRVAGAMIGAAADTATGYPGRIGYLLAAAPAVQHGTAPPQPAAPDWVQGPFRHLDPQTPRCRSHRGEPEHGCGKCRADTLAARQGDPEPAQRPEEASGVSGAALARKIASESRTGASTRPRRWPADPGTATPAPAPAAELAAGRAR